MIGVPRVVANATLFFRHLDAKSATGQTSHALVPGLLSALLAPKSREQPREQGHVCVAGRPSSTKRPDGSVLREKRKRTETGRRLTLVPALSLAGNQCPDTRTRDSCALPFVYRRLVSRG
jgi:hypothetical protein